MWCGCRWLFQAFYRLPQRMNINKMLAFHHLEFEGSEHSGIDDTRNITRIAVALAHCGARSALMIIIMIADLVRKIGYLAEEQPDLNNSDSYTHQGRLNRPNHPMITQIT